MELSSLRAGYIEILLGLQNSIFCGSFLLFHQPRNDIAHSHAFDAFEAGETFSSKGRKRWA